MNSPIEPLYKSMDEDDVEFFKTHDVKTTIIDVPVYEGGCSNPNCVRQGDLWYKVATSKGTAVLYGADYKNTTYAAIVVPATITYSGHTFTVTEIGEKAFYRCKLNSVILPDGLKKIGSGAFGCSTLTSVQFGSQLEEIGYGAFSTATQLTNVTLPASVKKMDNAVFAGCKSLKTAVMPPQLDHWGALTFYGCKVLTTVTLPKSPTELPPETFGQCPNLKVKK